MRVQKFTDNSNSRGRLCGKSLALGVRPQPSSGLEALRLGA